MTAPARSVLYSPELLSLAVDLAAFPHDAKAAAQGEARSRTCGSHVQLSSSEVDQLDRIGLRVSACAVGQAAAAIFAKGAAGRSPRDIVAAHRAVTAWLSDDAPMPEWPGIEALAAARAYPGRHAAILLPWTAALDALSNRGGER